MRPNLHRRTFLAGTAFSGAMSACSSPFFSKSLAFADKPQANPIIDLRKIGGRHKICAFIKFLQSLSYDRLAEVIAELGFDGIEATVRKGGHVLPERVEEDLPKLVESLEKHDLEISVMASSINQADQPHTEKVLRTASKLGVTCYRMDYYRYDLAQPLLRQLEEFGAMLKDLVAINREFGMQAVYQNHSGSRYVGAPVWDIFDLIQDYLVSDVGIAFDIGHATVEGGLAWPLNFQRARPHLGAVYFKDFLWKDRQPPKWCPLGTGQIDRKFVQQLKNTDFAGPVSLHVKYLQVVGVEKNIVALKQNLGTLRQWLA